MLSTYINITILLLCPEHIPSSVLWLVVYKDSEKYAKFMFKLEKSLGLSFFLEPSDVLSF